MSFQTNRFIKYILLLIAILPLLQCSSLHEIKNPNLIVIIIDTLRPDHLSCYGYTKIKTENIDRIAEEGMLFTEAVCQVPITLPSHCSIFTGRYPTAHGVRHNGLFTLGQSEMTLAEVLKENGFETGAFVGSYILNSGYGLEQGFNTYSDIKIKRGDQQSGDKLLEAQRVADKVNEDFFKWLPTVKDKRFFAWVHYYDPHFPYDPPSGGNRKLEGRGYDREISYSDQCLGDLLTKLREMNILDRSILLFASDHGESLGEHGEEGHGIFIYDCSTRVPLLLRIPWLLKGGSKYNGLFETVDIMPTLLGLLDVPVPPSVQGQSFAAEIKTGKHGKGKRESYSESYVPTLEYGWSELKSIRREEKKYIEAPIREFYDLLNDPKEVSNLYTSSDVESHEMQEALTSMISRISTKEADPYNIQQIDEEKIKVLKSLGYLSGEYFKSGEMKKGQDRVDPKIGIEEKNIFFRAAQLAAEGKVNDARPLFEQVLQKNPRNYQARLVIIKILLVQQDFEKAIAEAQKAIKIAELDRTAMLAFGPELWNMYGSLLARKKDFQGAQRAYRKGREINPNKEIAFTALAGFYSARQEYENALTIINEALAENPNGVTANSYLFRLSIDMNKMDQAADLAKKLAHYDMSGDLQTLSLAAKTLYKAKILPEAMIAYQQVLKINPGDKEAAGILGSICLSSGNLQQAQQIFEDLLSRDPEEFRAYYFLGIIDLQKNDEAAARKKFEKTLSLNPGFSQVYDSLGSWLKKNGRIDEAREEFKKALSVDPGDQIAMKEMKSIR